MFSQTNYINENIACHIRRIILMKLYNRCLRRIKLTKLLIVVADELYYKIVKLSSQTIYIKESIKLLTQTNYIKETVKLLSQINPLCTCGVEWKDAALRSNRAGWYLTSFRSSSIRSLSSHCRVVLKVVWRWKSNLKIRISASRKTFVTTCVTKLWTYGLGWRHWTDCKMAAVRGYCCPLPADVTGWWFLSVCFTNSVIQSPPPDTGDNL